ncbi:MAG: DNA repair protein RadA [Firmicutes bacterium]|nr:DNA repair protein RadA [Bacillota bacterium]
MAKKAKTVFVCNECGSENSKWVGQCPVCGAWNSMFEQKVVELKEDDKRRRTSGGRGNNGVESGGAGKPEKLSKIVSGETFRIDTGIGELNRVLGGGLVPGSLTLISGEPGIGKSTIILQAAQHIAETKGRVLYVSGEESEEQIKMRADRVCRSSGTAGHAGGQNGTSGNAGSISDPSESSISDNLFILAETNIENVAAVCETLDPEFLIVDSIQTMYSADIESAPGSVSQVRTCGNELMRIGKSCNIPVFIVAHVTKSGELAGPRIVEHMVDCVLSFTGDRSHEMRILRAQKNRFGTTSEIGAFEMAEEGLMEIENLSGVLLEEMDNDSEGAVATAVYEGTRPLILEVQALTSTCNVGFARRTSLGIDNSRLNMLLAVLEKKMGLKLLNQDVYVNVVGGIKPEGTYTDLAVALAVYSSYTGRKIDSKTLVLGEIGLTGDLRAVQNSDKIIREAERLGFERVILPIKNAARAKHMDKSGSGINVIGIRNISEVQGLL